MTLSTERLREIITDKTNRPWVRDLAAELLAKRDIVDISCNEIRQLREERDAVRADAERWKRMRLLAKAATDFRELVFLRDGRSTEDVLNSVLKAIAEQPKPADTMAIEPRPWWVVFGLERHVASQMHAEARRLGRRGAAERALQHLADEANKRGVHPAEIARALNEATAELAAEQPAGGA